MKKTLCRLTAFVLCLALCIVPMQFTPVSATTTTQTQPILAYVPLDDRPVVYDRMLYAGQAAGFDIRMPEYDDIRTRLDNQGVNDNGTQHGDGASIMTWLEDMDAAGCDLFIIHLDMMFSGGLVGSRYPDSATITSTERDIFNRLIALTNESDNKVYFIDIVMRLASTGGYMGYESAAYDAFRAYGAQARIVLDSSNYGTTNYTTSETYLTNIYNNYQKGVNGQTLTFNTGVLTQADINKYHSFRLRKMQLMNMMIQNVPKGTVYMVGVDDASPGNTIQSNELNFLYARMTALGLDYDVMYDTDSCGLMMLARVTNDYYGVKPKIEVRYFGTGADKTGDNYSNDTLRENVNKHIASMNASAVTSNGDIELLVLTKPTTDFTSTGKEDTDYKNAILSLVDAAEYNTANNVPTIIVDASDSYYQAWNKYYTNLQDEMVLNSTIEFGKLLGYSNWNTVGNALGIALGMGVSRYTYLTYEENIATSSHTAFARSLTFAYVKDIAYNARHKVNGQWYNRAQSMFYDRLLVTATGGVTTLKYKSDDWWTNPTTGVYERKEVTESGHWNQANFYLDMLNKTTGNGIVKSWTTGTGIEYKEKGEGERYINNFLQWYVASLSPATDTINGCAQVLDRIEHSEIYIDLNRKVQTTELTGVTLSGWRFPWFRTFEITFDITPTLSTSPHTYYSTANSMIYQVPLGQTQSAFVTNAKAQYGATSVTVKNASGTTVSTSTLIGTGFKVTLSGGSSAGTYTVVIPGDVYSDGLMNSNDVRTVMSAVIDSSTLSAACQEAADFNNSGSITSTDARQILQVMMGM